MKRTICLVAALLLASQAVRGQREGTLQGWSAEARMQQVEVSGKLHLSGTYLLRVAYRSPKELPPSEALLIYGEPSHTLLLAHVNPDAKWLAPESLVPAKPLALVYGKTQSFSHEISLPYNPKVSGDARVVVIMRDRGQDRLIADGKVNVSNFSYVTTFSTIELPDGEFDELRRHCCKGGKCAQICTECSGAFFTCDLINCDIDCNYL